MTAAARTLSALGSDRTASGTLRCGFSYRQHAVAATLFALVTLLFFFPLVHGDTFSDVAGREQQIFPWAGVVPQKPPRPVLHYDQDESFYPWQVFMSRTLKSGQFPLWNPYSFGGTPFFANGQSGVLYPPRLALAYALSPTRVHDVLLASHMFLAGVAMFLLLGFVGVSFPGALAGALAWMLNSFALAWQALEHYVAIEVWLPVGILLAHAAVRRRSWPASFGLALSLGLLFVGGNALFVELAAAAILLYAATLAVVDARRERASLGGSAARVGVAAALFAGLGAVWYLPTLRVVATSVRVSLGYQQLGVYKLSAGSLLTLLRPYASPLVDPYHHDLFAGTAVALAAAVGLVRREALPRFAAVLALLTILFMLHTPVTYVVDHALPGFRNFKPLARAAFLLQFSVAVLAAYGIDIVVAGLSKGRGRRLAASPLLLGTLAGIVADRVIRAEGSAFPSGSGVFAAIALALAALLLAGRLAGLPRKDMLALVLRSLLPPVVLGAGIDWAVVRFVQQRNPTPTGMVLTLAAVAAAVGGYELARGRRGRESAGGAARAAAAGPVAVGFVVVVVLATTVWQGRQWARQVMPHQPDAARFLYPATPLVRWLERHPGTRMIPTFPSFRGSTAMLYPIASAGGYESLLPGRTENFWRAVGDRVLPTALASTPLIYAYHPQFELPKLSPALLARSGVDYVVTPPPGSTVGAPPRGLRLLYAGPDGRIYGVAGALPQAYVVRGCDEAATPLAALERFVAPGFDAGGSVLLERGWLARARADCSGTPGRVGSATVDHRSVNELDLRVDARAPGWLVVASSWDRGWTAAVAGRPTPVLPGDYALRAIRVPAGRETVRLRYEPPSFRGGAAVSSASLVVVLLGLVGSLVRRRRRRVG